MGMRGSPAQVAVTVRNFDKLKGKAELNAFRRGLTFARGLLVNLYTTHGIGRSIFGKKKGGMRLLIKRVKVQDDGNRIKGGLEVRGIAALIELGGKTKAHEIRPKARWLAFAPTGGRIGSIFGQEARELVFAKLVKHPGSRIPKTPQAERALRESVPRINIQIGQAHQELINRLGLGR